MWQDNRLRKGHGPPVRPANAATESPGRPGRVARLNVSEETKTSETNGPASEETNRVDLEAAMESQVLSVLRHRNTDRRHDARCGCLLVDDAVRNNLERIIVAFGESLFHALSIFLREVAVLEAFHLAHLLLINTVL